MGYPLLLETLKNLWFCARLEPYVLLLKVWSFWKSEQKKFEWTGRVDRLRWTGEENLATLRVVNFLRKRRLKIGCARWLYNHTIAGSIPETGNYLRKILKSIINISTFCKYIFQIILKYCMKGLASHCLFLFVNIGNWLLFICLQNASERSSYSLLIEWWSKSVRLSVNILLNSFVFQNDI